MKNQSRHSRAGGNPVVVLLNMPLGLAFAAQRSCFINWIPACAGMTKIEVMV